MPLHLILTGAGLFLLAAVAQAQTLRESRSAGVQPVYATVPVDRDRARPDPYDTPAAGNGFTGAFSASQAARNLGY